MARATCTAALMLLLLGAATAAERQSDALDRAFSSMYNLDFATAHQTLRDYEQVSPNDPRAPVSAAAAFLFQELDRLGLLDARHFANDGAFKSLRRHPDAAIRRRFDEAIARAEALARPQLAQDPDNCDGLFALTLVDGLRADYAALIEDRGLAALRHTKASSQTAERLLRQCHEYDAYVGLGISRYLIGSKPAPVRWLLRLGGYSGDKQQGIAELKLAAERGRYLAPFARILLSLAYVREKNFLVARQMLEQLRRDYPHNPLFARELGRLDLQTD